MRTSLSRFGIEVLVSLEVVLIWGLGGGMLRGMQQSGQSQSSTASGSFAGLLTTLTSTQSEAVNIAPLWSDGDLGEDVAKLSYESALRAHQRYRTAGRGEWTAGADDSHAGAHTGAPGAAKTGDGVVTKASGAAPSGNDGDLRRASVTIRLSQAEMERLRQRACEAGLTISAYLRSCTFEAETLRAQVKEALAELRKAGTEETKETGKKGTRERRSEEPGRQWGLGWITRIVARRHRK